MCSASEKTAARLMSKYPARHGCTAFEGCDNDGVFRTCSQETVAQSVQRQLVDVVHFAWTGLTVAFNRRSVADLP
jgi:hypothetical protein